MYKGGHRDGRIDDMMRRKNIETYGEYEAKNIGDRGEHKLSEILRSLPDEYKIVDNVMLQKGKGTTQLDHIIVSNYGIIIIETKNHKGMIFGSDGAVWTQVLYGGKHFKMYSPVLQNSEHIKALSESIKIVPDVMSGIIVFTNEDADLSNVDCPWCMNIDYVYKYILDNRNMIFNDKQVISIIKRIDKVNIDSYMNREKHKEYVRNIKERRGF